MTPEEYLKQTNSMQTAAGLIPPFTAMAPPTPWPNQSAAMMQNMFAQPVSMFTNMNPLMPGPNGVYMPMASGGPMSPFGAPTQTGMPPPWPGIYQAPRPLPPPSYMGLQGRNPSFLPGTSIAPQGGFFENPYQYAVAQQNATNDRITTLQNVSFGSTARLATNALVGGAAMHMLGGNPLAFGAGMIGSELLGIGRAGQNSFMRNVMAPVLNMQGYASGLQEQSKAYISGGAFGEIGGPGFNRVAATQLARGLEDLSNSRDFRHETMNRFNTADVMRITQTSGENGLFNGSQNPEQIKTRVREIAKSVSMFMELANEPDLRRALQTMGSMQMQGLTTPETINAVRNGRAYARMAGTSFEAMGNLYGATGAQTFQSMGLTQGLGFQTGMMHGGLAHQTQALGTTSSALMNLVGGTQGLANLNTMFSAGQLQMPMLAPAMMTANGGLNVNALRGLLSGQMNSFGMTGMGAGSLSSMAGRMGVEGLGMALSMQPLMQDQIGRLLQGRSPFAQRNMEDSMMLNNMRQMGMSGTSGFITMARIHGMDANQALIRAQELGSPEHFQRMREQIEVRRRERGAEYERDRESRANVGVLDELTNAFGFVGSIRRGVGNVGTFFRDLAEDLNVGDQSHLYRPGTAQARRRIDTYARSRNFLSDFRETSAEAATMGRSDDRGVLDRYRADLSIMQARGGAGISANLGALAPIGMAERSRIEEQMQIGGRLASGLLHTDVLSRQAALRNETGIFGSFQGRQDVAQDVVQMINSGVGGYGGAGLGAGTRAGLNLAFRGGISSLSFGLVDPGRISQSGMFSAGQLQEAYVGRMVQQGRSRQQALDMFNQNRQQIVAGISNEVMFYGDANTQRELERAAGVGATAGGRLGGNVAQLAERHLNEGYQAVLGINTNIHSADGRRQAGTLDRLLDMQGEGYGNTGEQRSRSRQIMAALTLARSVKGDQTSSNDQRVNANNQLRQIIETARREGYSQEQISGMMESVRSQESTVSRLGGIRDIFNNTSGMAGRDLVDAMSRFERGRNRGTLERQVSQSVGFLGNLGGEAGRLFSGLDQQSGDFSQNLRNRLLGAYGDRDRLSQLQHEDPRLARIAQRVAQGGEAGEQAMTDALQYMRRRGELADQYRNEYRNAGRVGRLFGSRFKLGESEDTFVRRNVTSGILADEQANRQLSDVDQTEDSARRAGIGTSNDQMARAAREFTQAVNTFRDTVEGSSMNNLVGPGQ